MEDWPPDDEHTGDDDDQLRAARGILLGVLLAAVFWIVLGFVLIL
jgi:hypothetical protein